MNAGPRLLSVQVGLPRERGRADAPDPMDRPWRSGIFKDPVAGPVWLGRTNLEGDGQADLRVHGGPEKAVLAYAAGHYPAWREELGLAALAFGAFGENFTLEGLAEDDVCIGDTFAVGQARIQVSQPRTPCWKLAWRFRRPDLAERVIATGHSGWYFRVLEEGRVEAGTALTLLDRPHPDLSVARVSCAKYPPGDPEAAAALADCTLLSAGWRDSFRRLLRR